MGFKAGLGARLGLKGSLEFKNRTGEVIKTVDLSGSFKIDDLFRAPAAETPSDTTPPGATSSQTTGSDNA